MGLVDTVYMDHGLSGHSVYMEHGFSGHSVYMEHRWLLQSAHSLAQPSVMTYPQQTSNYQCTYQQEAFFIDTFM
jgi:hypothetical protein